MRVGNSIHKWLMFHRRSFPALFQVGEASGIPTMESAREKIQTVMKGHSCAVWGHAGSPWTADPHPDPHSLFSHLALVLDPGVPVMAPLFLQKDWVGCCWPFNQQPLPLEVSDLKRLKFLPGLASKWTYPIKSVRGHRQISLYMQMLLLISGP